MAARREFCDNFPRQEGNPLVRHINQGRASQNVMDGDSECWIETYRRHLKDLGEQQREMEEKLADTQRHLKEIADLCQKGNAKLKVLESFSCTWPQDQKDAVNETNMRLFSEGKEGEDLDTADNGVPGSEHIAWPENLPDPAPASRGATIRSELAGTTAVVAGSSRGADVISARGPSKYGLTSVFTPINEKDRTPQDEQRQLASLSIDPILQPSQPPLTPTNQERTANNLILKNDGIVYTYPECVKDVPVIKIDEAHGYWEESWVNMERFFRPMLLEEEEKYDIAARDGRDLGQKNAANRKIKHLNAILDFHKKGPISPYQLLSKRYPLAVKGGPSIRVLFVLSSTLSDLAKCNLDIPPVQWLRERLHELIQDRGHRFKLAKTLRDFETDPEFVQLQIKNGLKTRQSRRTGKQRRARGGSHSHTPSSQGKRSSAHLASAVLDGDSLTNKRVCLSPTSGPMFGKLDFKAWSDIDSCSGGSITEDDWRLSQVKTRLYTSHKNVTQYWTWKDDIQCFQLQLLKDCEPTKWGLFRDEIDFDVYPAKIERMMWNIESLHVRIIMKSTEEAARDGKPRGDVMAIFKRERPKNRFLDFCKERGIEMAEKEECELQRCWDSMVSEQLLSGNDKQCSFQTPGIGKYLPAGRSSKSFVRRIGTDSTNTSLQDYPDDARDAVDVEKRKAAQSEWKRMNEKHKAHGKCGCRTLCDSGCSNAKALILCDNQTCTVRDCKKHSTLKEKSYLQVNETENNGKGLYLCGDDAQEGAKLAQYFGSPIFGDDLRQLRNGNDNEITEGHYVVKLKHGDLFLDAANEKIMAKYANHSCQPNCELQEWQHSNGLALFLVASKLIKKGDPITFQYHPTDPPTSIRVRFNKQQHDQGVCYCASEPCQWPPNKAIEGVLNWVKEQCRCAKSLGKVPLTIDFTFPRNPRPEHVTLDRKWTDKMMVSKVKKILESKLPIGK